MDWQPVQQDLVFIALAWLQSRSGCTELMIRTVHEVLLLWLCVEFVFLLVSGSLQKQTHTHTHSASESSRSKAKERRGFESEDVRTARPEPKPCFFAWGSALAALEPWANIAPVERRPRSWDLQILQNMLGAARVQ